MKAREPENFPSYNTFLWFSLHRGRGQTNKNLSKKKDNQEEGQRTAQLPIVENLLVILTAQGKGPYSSTNKNLS